MGQNIQYLCTNNFFVDYYIIVIYIYIYNCYMSKKRNDKESMSCLMLKPSQSFFVYLYTKQRKKFTEKVLFKEKGEDWWRLYPLGQWAVVYIYIYI